ncbi:50S ribosomal protein L28 [Clostridiisalibacter paucivorans]|uniref:50S ribosomal protein L28 n=1 Tax=Clostridiisalibacter paucivorans TaxID=408753 RepID=UPI00047D8B53|nr:50S ribosomal protein L28 [Clostridiisalibacter paucivorans]
MANYCEVCGKGKMSGNNVSFSMRHSRRTWKPNIRKVKVVIDGTPRRMNVCTRCLRSDKVKRAL